MRSAAFPYTYNGSAAPCDATAITLPISNRTVETTLGTQVAKTYAAYNTYGLPTQAHKACRGHPSAA